MAKHKGPYTGKHRKAETGYQESVQAVNWRKYGRVPGHITNEPRTSAEEAEILRERAAAITGGEISVTYAPTSTSNPADPRTAAAGYDPIAQTLYVEWGDGGAAYNYYNVTPQEWDAFRKAPSPGRYINRVLNYKIYGRA